MFSIGPYDITAPAVLAPMAGVTDLPFRQLCRRFGAGMTVTEMITADTRLWHTDKSRLRLPHGDEPEPRAVQIAGSDPAMLAHAARENVKLGAQIIDINMGCPAKKVCKRAAGSALLADEDLVARILEAVVTSVAVPVTLKIRTGTSPDQRNGPAIARIAEDAGVQALAVHGRTRACKFRGQAEFDTLAAIVAQVSIPVIANGDITTPQRAREVLDYTGAAAVMVGRSARGRPWIFRDINHYLATGVVPPAPSPAEIHSLITGHLSALHRHYGEFTGVRVARKHLGWYLDAFAPGDAGAALRRRFNAVHCPREQHLIIDHFFATTPTRIQEHAA